jgi:hypothetical protein
MRGEDGRARGERAAGLAGAGASGRGCDTAAFAPCMPIRQGCARCHLSCAPQGGAHLHADVARNGQRREVGGVAAGGAAARQAHGRVVGRIACTCARGEGGEDTVRSGIWRAGRLAVSGGGQAMLAPRCLRPRSPVRATSARPRLTAGGVSCGCWLWLLRCGYECAERGAPASGCGASSGEASGGKSVSALAPVARPSRLWCGS